MTLEPPATAAGATTIRAEEGSPRRGGHSWTWSGIAFAVFVVVAVGVYGEVWRADPTTTVPVAAQPDPAWQRPTRMDVQFAAWLASRNARALATRPTRLFDAEHCAPAEATLTLGTPSIAMGMLALPAWLATGDPVLSYNVGLLLLCFASALGMFLLVGDWTGMPAAGIVAGILYAFHPVQLNHIHHATVWDSSWTLLALFFARRWFAGGLWRDALGLCAATGMQMAACFYPMATAVFVASPFLVWLVARYGVARIRLAQVVAVGLGVLLAVALVYGPYLDARGGSDILRRAHHYYAGWRDFAPGGRLFVGWLPLALAGLGLARGARVWAAGSGSDPRLAILAGGILAAVLSAGPLGNSLLAFLGENGVTRLNPYAALAAVVPGFDAVRAAWRVGRGLQLAVVALAGMGAAVAIRACGRRRALAAAGLVALACLDVLRLPGLGFERAYRWKLESIRPEPAALEFHAALEAMGNAGPLFEVPDEAAGFLGMGADRSDSADRVLLSAYHHRRTSACFGSFHSPTADDVAAIAARLQGRDAVRELSRLGFTTLVVHHAKGPSRAARRWMARIEAGGASSLRPLHRTRYASAFAIPSER